MVVKLRYSIYCFPFIAKKLAIMSQIDITELDYENSIEVKGYTKLKDCDENKFVKKNDEPAVVNTVNDFPINNSIRVSLSQEQICINANGDKIQTRKSNLKIKDQPKLISLGNPWQIIDSTNAHTEKTSNKTSILLTKEKPMSHGRKFSIPIVGLGSIMLANKINKKTNDRPPRPDRRNTSTELQSSFVDKYKCLCCKHIFSDPRVLECLHTFCLHCIISMESSDSVQCGIPVKPKLNDIGEMDLNG